MKVDSAMHIDHSQLQRPSRHQPSAIIGELQIRYAERGYQSSLSWFLEYWVSQQMLSSVSRHDGIEQNCHEHAQDERRLNHQIDSFQKPGELYVVATVSQH